MFWDQDPMNLEGENHVFWAFSWKMVQDFLWIFIKNSWFSLNFEHFLWIFIKNSWFSLNFELDFHWFSLIFQEFIIKNSWFSLNFNQGGSTWFSLIFIDFQLFWQYLAVEFSLIWFWFQFWQKSPAHNSWWATMFRLNTNEHADFFHN